MARRNNLTPGNILTKVNEVLDKLNKRYVVTINYRRSKGPGNVNIGGTKTELIYWVFDTELEDWTHQPSIVHGTFEDSDGTIWWPDTYNHLKHDVEVLNEKAGNLA